MITPHPALMITPHPALMITPHPALMITPSLALMITPSLALMITPHPVIFRPARWPGGRHRWYQGGVPDPATTPTTGPPSRPPARCPSPPALAARSRSLSPTARGAGPALAVMLAGVFWGTTGTAQALSEYPGSSLGLGVARTWVTAVILVAFTGWTHGRAALALVWRPARPAIRRTLLFGAAAVGAYQLLFFAATRDTGVAVGTLTAIGSAPIAAGVLAVAFGIRPGRAWLVATAVALTGLCLLVVVPSGDAAIRPLGVLAGLGAGAAYATYTWCSRRLLGAGVPPAVLLAAFFAGATMLTAPLGWRPAVDWLADRDGLAVVGYLAVVATVLPYAIWIGGMAATPPAVATTLTLTEPLTATLLAVFLLGEALTPVALGGAGLIALGLLLTVLETVRGERQKVAGRSPPS